MYTIYGATHTGMVREHNEDCFGGAMFTPGYGYALVCDGMGGENGGSIASRLACDEVARIFDGSHRNSLDENSIYMLIEAAIENANVAVYNRAQDDIDQLAGMGTTACIAVLWQDTCYTASVGDSRAYLLHDGVLTQLTVDHTLVQAMVDRGEITHDMVASHPQRHYLTRAVGIEPSLTAYYRQVTLVPGDRVLICSDGLSGMLEPDELARLLAHSPAEECCELLIDEANKTGGFDNITAMVIEAGGVLYNG